MPKDNSAESQRARILKYLREIGTLTTLQCRHLLDVMHPSQRCLELRRSGHRIVCTWTRDTTPEGFQHRVGKYQLLPGGQMNLIDFLGQIMEVQSIER